MFTRREALGIARQIRTCPPAHVKNDPRYKKQVKTHVAACPYCTTGQTEEIDAWQDLAENMKHRFGPADNCPDPAPGQIRLLDPGLGCFRGYAFYNPPAVMVLRPGPPGSKEVLVAQTYDDLALAGPGDLILPPGMTEETGALFIQPWNIYTLDICFLGPCLGILDDQVTAAVMAMDENPEAVPGWALVPMPMKEEDARLYFRELEIETGFTFATMAAGQSMAHVASDASVPLGLNDLMAAIKEKIAGIDWDWVPGSIKECMAAIRFPSHVLPMAAAQDKDETITASYFSFTGEGLSQVKPVQCRIDYAAKPPAPYSVSGFIDSLPSNIPDTAFQCYIRDDKNKLLLSCNFILDGTGRFMAVFDRPLQDYERPVLFIVHQENQE